MVLITLSSDKSNSEYFEVYYNVPITLNNDNYEIALIGCNIWFSWYNISHEYKNNFLKFLNGHTWETIVLPNGFYTIDLINYYLNSISKRPSDSGHRPLFLFEINEISSRCVVRLKSGYKVDFSDGKLHEIFGFESKVIDKDKTEGKYPINISKGIDRILIHCSLVE